ncbi:hypothetical protein B0H16DRAFT_261658 [Mycena metata]|uniref:Uncharacterized protein n=1 Tax=Mycena metata TaxID=1033252 RepID=A0AAD7HRZ8_9AGAR|nr:hypothetical protein B0H16DRAFT_261658 [Mycena metata]
MSVDTHKDATTSLPLDSEALPTTQRSTLTVSYRSLNNGDEPRYAMVPYPQTYEQAVSNAFRILGKYITSSATQVVLKYSARNQDGERIWIEFTPADWLLIVPPGSEVGLFEKQSLLHSKATFWCGPVYLVFDRPGSYVEAVEATHKCCREASALGYGSETVLEPGKTLNFFTFKHEKTGTTTTEWAQFPSSTTTNDDTWKIFVPPPRGVLGVIAI